MASDINPDLLNRLPITIIFHGQSQAHYGIDWHKALSSKAKVLNEQDNFAAAKILRDVQTKALEPAYNYYGVEAVPMSKKLWVALLALAGYVLYTIWYGFAILFLFEGWGLRLEH